MASAPFPNWDPNDDAATPYRQTSAKFDVPGWLINRKRWSKWLLGKEISPLVAANVSPADQVILLPSGWWSAKPLQYDLQFERSSIQGSIFRAPPAGGALQWTLATGLTEFPMDRGPTSEEVDRDLTPGPDTLGTGEQGNWFIEKRVAAGASYLAELTADVAALHKPVLPSANKPMDRIAVSGVFASNSAYCLRFGVPAGRYNTSDTLLTFYFGGPATVVMPAGKFGGQFALVLFTNGLANLYEWTNDGLHPPWRFIGQFEYTSQNTSNQTYALFVIPHQCDHLDFVFLGYGNDNGQRTFGAVSGAGVRTTRSATGYDSKSEVSGQGPVRMDIRRDFSIPFQLSLLTYPFAGAPAPNNYIPQLLAAPFTIDFAIPAGTAIFIDKNSWELTPGAIGVQLYDAVTGAPLADNGDGSFQSTTSRSYQVGFTFHTAAGYSPLLRGYRPRIEGVRSLLSPTPYSGGALLQVSLSGQDVEAGLETGYIEIDDYRDEIRLTASGTGLSVNADIRTQIVTAYDPADQTKTCKLFDGVLVRAAGTLLGKHGATEGAWGTGAAVQDPSPNRRLFQCHMVGMHFHLAEPGQVNWQGLHYDQDPAEPIDPQTGAPPPWRATAVVRDILGQAGFDTTQINIPDVDIRLFARPNSRDYMINPGQQFLAIINDLLKKYLPGGALHWDENAGADGQWRILYPPVFRPAGDYAFVWHFVVDAPAGANKLVHSLDSYPAGTSYLEVHTMFPTTPEANYVKVVAGVPPSVNPEEIVGNSYGYMAPLRNPRSFDLDPAAPSLVLSSVDRVGHMRAFVDSDPLLQLVPESATERAVEYRTRALFEGLAYGRIYHQGGGPLPLYFDPDVVYGGKPRKLRPYDCVTVDYGSGPKPVVLTSVSVSIRRPRGDREQMCHIEGFEPPIPLGY